MKRLSGYLGTALLSTAVVLLIAGDTFAQRGGRGGRGGGGWGGGGWGGGGWGGSSNRWYGGYSPWTGPYFGYGYPSYGYGYGRGYGYGGGYGYYPSYGGGYYSGYYSPGYDYGYDYPSYGYSAPSYGYSMPSYGTPAGYAAPSTQDNSVAHIEVRVPDPNADVMFDGQKTQQRGAVRTFTTPPLDSGSYSYRISAAWDRDGRKVTQERIVNVQPGRSVTVDFTQGQTGASGTSGTLPPPRKTGEQGPDR